MTLIERQYLGVGYIHMFKDNSTSTTKVVPCTLAEFNSIKTTPPTMTGHTWIGSTAGTARVDTSDTILGKGEYCVIDGMVLVNKVDKVPELITSAELTTLISLETI
jgi:hypothetical protein